MFMTACKSLRSLGPAIGRRLQAAGTKALVDAVPRLGALEAGLALRLVGQPLFINILQEPCLNY